MSFKLTYATMFDPPEELHTQFEKALAETRATLGKEYGLIIGGKEVKAAKKFEKRSPINVGQNALARARAAHAQSGKHH
jgi:1-pyrroline-5-carboxylate dehydrogenase